MMPQAQKRKANLAFQKLEKSGLYHALGAESHGIGIGSNPTSNRPYILVTIPIAHAAKVMEELPTEIDGVDIIIKAI